MGHPTNPVFSDTPVIVQQQEYGDRYRTDLVEVTDWLGRPVHVGDRVMYCIGAGRGQMMALGTVKAMRGREIQIREFNHETRTWSAYFMSWEIQIQVLTEKTSGAWDNAKRSRPAWVNPMNITALPQGWKDEGS